MTRRIALVSLTLFATAAVYVVVTLLAALVGWAIAHADPLAPAADDYSVVARHGFWGAALVVFGVASKLLQRGAADNWLRRGRWLAIVTGATSVIAAALNWRLNGGDPDAIFNALLVAVPLALSPTVGDGKPAE